MPPGDLILAAVRGLHLAALFGAAGALVVAILAQSIWLRATARRLLLAAIGTGVVWFVWQAQMVTATGWPQAQVTMLATGFGRVMALRLALLLAACLIRPAALPLVIAAIALQPLLGHGAATTREVTVSGAVHVLAGAIWAGSLPWLWLLLGRDPGVGVQSAHRFSPLGVVLVLLLGAGALGQLPLIGGIPGIFGTGYGQALLVKSGLLLVMLICAALNGIWLAPTGRAIALRRSIAVEGLAGAGVVFTAAWLALQPPGAHDTVLWPFDHQPVPGLWTDAFLRDRLIRMAMPLGVAALLLLAALVVLRHGRILSLGLVGAAGLTLSQMPVFPAAPFLRPALPTSFQTADTRRSTVSTLRGAVLFARDCSGCHGTDARRAGPDATGDPVWPPDLTAGFFRTTRDGDWFWRIRYGMRSRDGLPSMPGFPDLTDTEVWQLVDYLRALASARSLDADGRWQNPPAAPALRLRCEGMAGTRDLSRPPEGMLIYWGRSTPPEGALHVDPGRCEAPGADMAATLDLLAGRELAPEVELLVDRGGYIRQIWEVTPDPEALAAAVDWARVTPVMSRGGHH